MRSGKPFESFRQERITPVMTPPRDNPGTEQHSWLPGPGGPDTPFRSLVGDPTVQDAKPVFHFTY